MKLSLLFEDWQSKLEILQRKFPEFAGQNVIYQIAQLDPTFKSDSHSVMGGKYIE